MILPAVQPFPAPTLFPVPNPDNQTFGMGIGDSISPLQAYMPPATQSQYGVASVAGDTYQSRMLQALGFEDGSGEQGMTLGNAQAQTDRALARIASVNPELAQQLSAQRGDPSEDQGFWGGLLSSVASSPLGKALELITRPGRIIPEILTDTDESIWKNVGDALSGKSNASMSQFLDKYNILQGDDIFSKVAKGATSFFLDVAVDPLTYLTMGMGAVGRQMATRFGSKVVAKAVMYEQGTSLLDNIVSTVGNKALGLADDVVDLATTRSAAFEHLWKGATGQRSSLSRLGRWGSLADDMSVVDPDFVGGILGVSLRDGEKAVFMQAMKSADEAHKLIGKFGWNRIGPKMAEGAGIPRDTVNEILTGMKKAGHFSKDVEAGLTGRAAYMQAKYAGALQGGVRFSIPGFRVITPAIWGTSKMDFSIARRFMSGLSGQMRVMRAVESGAIEAKVGMQALELATTGGWNAIKEGAPQVAQLFGGMGGRLGSGFASASWQIGGITRNLGSYALVRGGGLGDALSADARKMVRTVKGKLQAEALTFEARRLAKQGEESLIGEIADSGWRLDAVGDIVKHGRGVMQAPMVQRTLHQLDRLVAAKGDRTLTIRVLEAFPTAQAQKMGAHKYYDLLEADIRARYLPGDVLDKALAKNEVRRQGAIAVEKKLKDVPEAAMAARMYRVAANQTRDIYNEMGGHAENMTVRTQSEAVINPLNRVDVETGHAVQHGKTFELADPNIESNGQGFGIDEVTDNAEGRGYKLREVDPDAPKRTPEARQAGGDTPPPSGPEGQPRVPTTQGPDAAAEAIPKATKEQLADLIPKHPIQAGESSVSYFERLDRIAAGLPEKEATGPITHLPAPGAAAKAVPDPQPQSIEEAASRIADDAVMTERYHAVGKRMPKLIAGDDLRDLKDALEKIVGAEADDPSTWEHIGGSRANFAAQLEREGQQTPITISVDRETGDWMVEDGYHRILATPEDGVLKANWYDHESYALLNGADPSKARLQDAVNIEGRTGFPPTEDDILGAQILAQQDLKRTASPEGFSVDLAGMRLDKSGKAVGDIDPKDIRWIRTQDLRENADVRLPRTESAEPGKTLEDYAKQLNDTKKFPKPVEATIIDGRVHITDGNHTLDAASMAGIEYVPVVTMHPGELPDNATLQQKLATLDVPGKPLSEISPEKFREAGLVKPEDTARLDMNEQQAQDFLESMGLKAKKDPKFTQPDRMTVAELKQSWDPLEESLGSPIYDESHGGSAKAFADSIRTGQEKPVRLAYDPDTGEYVMMDGYHRTYALDATDELDVEWVPDKEFVQDAKEWRQDPQKALETYNPNDSPGRSFDASRINTEPLPRVSRADAPLAGSTAKVVDFETAITPGQKLDIHFDALDRGTPVATGEDAKKWIEKHVAPENRVFKMIAETGSDDKGNYAIRLDYNLEPVRYDLRDIAAPGQPLRGNPPSVAATSEPLVQLPEATGKAIEGNLADKIPGTEDMSAFEDAARMRIGGMVEVPNDPGAEAIAQAFSVPDEQLDMIDDFAKIEALDPKWEKYRGVMEIEELPMGGLGLGDVRSRLPGESMEDFDKYFDQVKKEVEAVRPRTDYAAEYAKRGMNEEQYTDLFEELQDEMVKSVDAWHAARYEQDPYFREWRDLRAENPDMPYDTMEEYAAKVFGDQMADVHHWDAMTPSDYLAVMGPGGLDAEMTAMREILGEALGVRDPLIPRFRDIVGKSFVPDTGMEVTTLTAADKAAVTRALGPKVPNEAGGTAKPVGGPRKQAVIALKNPVIINKDEAKMIAKGKRPVPSTTEGNIDIVAEADEYVAKTMELLNENWDTQVRKILDSPVFSAKSEETQKVLKDLGLDPAGMTDEMARIVLENQDSIASRLRTQFYEGRGYDGVITIENGKQEAIVFEKGFLTADKAPIWQMSLDAPVNHAELGYYSRRMNPAITERLEGKSGHTERRAPKDWDAHFARATKDMNFDEAEAKYREMLNDMGIEIGPEEHVLDSDVAANLFGYVDGMAGEAGNVFLGREARKLRSMGLTRSPFVGNFVGPRYEAAPTQAYLNSGSWLKRQSEKLWGLSQRVAQHQTKVAKAGQKVVARLERSVSELNERLQKAIDDELATTERAVTRSIRKDARYTMEDRQRLVNDFKITKSSAEERGAVREELGDGVFKLQDEGMTHFWTEHDGRIAAFRSVHYENGDVMTARIPNKATTGDGYKLLKAEMKDRGITDPVAFRKTIRENELSAASGKNRLRYAREELLTPENVRPGLSKQLEGRSAELDRAKQKIDWEMNTQNDVMEEWNRIRHDAEARVAEPQVALGFGDIDRAGMGKVMVPGLEGMHMPAVMADEFNIAARGFKSLNEFQKVWRRYLSWWKEWATWAWPGFHIRNAMGGWFNNWLGGVQFNDYVHVGRAMRARREIETGAERKWANTKLTREFLNEHGLAEFYFGAEPTYGDIASLFTRNGINSASSRSFGEARIGAELLDKEMSKPADSPWTLVDKAFGKNVKAGKPGRVIARSLRGTGEMTENMLRGASFLQGLKQTNGDMMGAHQFTMMRHGDYGDLTDWEYGAIRDVVPFYKWMRTNTPLQIHQLFERPAHLLATIHAKEAIWNVSGLDMDEARSRMPEWAMQGFNFPIPGSTDEAINLVTGDLPMNDLYQGAGEFISQMLPLARPFLESYVTNKSLFTGKPIEGAPVKVGWVSDVPFLGKLMAGIGMGDMGPDGSYYIDDKLQNVIGVIPVISRFRNWIYEDPARSKLRMQTMVSAVAGIGLRPFNESDFMSEELNFYYSHVVPQMEYLKEIGYPLPTTEDLNNLYGASNNVLIAAGIDPKGV